MRYCYISGKIQMSRRVQEDHITIKVIMKQGAAQKLSDEVDVNRLTVAK